MKQKDCKIGKYYRVKFDDSDEFVKAKLTKSDGIIDPHWETKEGEIYPTRWVSEIK